MRGFIHFLIKFISHGQSDTERRVFIPLIIGIPERRDNFVRVSEISASNPFDIGIWHFADYERPQWWSGERATLLFVQNRTVGRLVSAAMARERVEIS